MSLVVIGTVALDSVRTPSGIREEALGGSAIYFSVAASCFTPVKISGVVGEDFPAGIVTDLAARGIDTAGLVRIPGRTFRWKGEYGQDLNEARTLETQLNVLERFDPVLPAGYRESPYLFLANIDPVLQAKVKAQMSGTTLVAADTMNFWIEGKRQELNAVLKDIDLLVINDAEARMLAREPSLPRAARDIRRLGPKAVIVKRGEYGVALFGEEETFAAPAFPLEDVLDPTGAGDSFAGGMMGFLAAGGGLAEGRLRQAMIYGSVMASFCVEQFSVERLLTLSRREVDQRFREFEALTRFEPIGEVR
ncbi:MAG: PfkB family carbohydrate kinase [Acidobacteriota bacterium]